jgi:hypothetical protein
MDEAAPHPGAEIYYDPQFLAQQEATRFFEPLLFKCAWTRHKGVLAHRDGDDEPARRYFSATQTRRFSRSTRAKSMKSSMRTPTSLQVVRQFNERPGELSGGTA